MSGGNVDDSTIRPVPAAELSLPGEARSAGVARRFLMSTLTGWDNAPDGDDASLMLSELVTNAALHAKTDIVVRVELNAECLRLSVTDGSPRQPVVRHYSDQSTTGRGLALVSALALRWGITPHSDGTKTVWAELAAANRGGRGSRPEVVADLSAFPDLEDAPPLSDGGRGGTSLFQSAA
jgi:anti-sigma regulatory factor (Ser/Thr protein kinase)